MNGYLFWAAIRNATAKACIKFSSVSPWGRKRVCVSIWHWLVGSAVAPSIGPGWTRSAEAPASPAAWWWRLRWWGGWGMTSTMMLLLLTKWDWDYATTLLTRTSSHNWLRFCGWRLDRMGSTSLACPYGELVGCFFVLWKYWKGFCRISVRFELRLFRKIGTAALVCCRKCIYVWFQICCCCCYWIMFFPISSSSLIIKSELVYLSFINWYQQFA